MMWEGLSPPYRTIVADPPWSYSASVTDKQEGGLVTGRAEHQYATMTNAEIEALPVRELAADQAHLYLWVTVPRLFGGRNDRSIAPLDIVEAWGFEFKTMLTWIKPGTGGMGWYFRGQTEHVLFATRGGLGIPVEKREPNVFSAPRRGGHSVKPQVFADLVERVSPDPRVELFARAPRLGWDHWGFGYEAAS